MPLNFQERYQVLVVEDDESSYMLFKAVLQDCAVVRAVNGVEAVDEMKKGSFDLVIMDIVMPIMNGIEATKRIREFDNATPIIIVSASALNTDRIHAADAGSNYFVEKPIRTKVFRDLVHEVINHKD